MLSTAVTTGTLNMNETYYLQWWFERNNSPASEIYAYRINSKDTGVNIKQYTYQATSNSIQLNLTLEDTYSIDSIKYKKTSSQSNNWESIPVEGQVGTQKNYTINNLEPGTVYDFQFTQTNNGSTSIIGVAVASTSLGPIQNLSASDIGDSTVKLTWDAQALADSYRVYERGNNTETLVADEITTNSITLDHLKAVTDYTFIVVPYKAGTAENKDTSVNVNTICTSVRDIKQVIDNGYKISWEMPSSVGACTYNVYYKKSTESNSEWKTFRTGVTDKSVTIGYDSLANGCNYDVKVIALKYNMESNPSIVSFLSKSAPASFTSNSSTADSITVNWNNPSGLFSNIVLYYKEKGTATLHPLKSVEYNDQNNADSKTYTISDLKPKTQYEFVIYSYPDEYRTDELKTASSVTVSTK